MLNPIEYYKNHQFEPYFYRYMEYDLSMEEVAILMAIISKNEFISDKILAHEMAFWMMDCLHIKTLKWDYYYSQYKKYLFLFFRIIDDKNDLLNKLIKNKESNDPSFYKVYIRSALSSIENDRPIKILDPQKKALSFTYKNYTIQEVATYQECWDIGKTLQTCTIFFRHWEDIAERKAIRLMIKSGDLIVGTIRIGLKERELYGFMENYVRIEDSQVNEIFESYNFIRKRKLVNNFKIVGHGVSYKKYHAFL